MDLPSPQRLRTEYLMGVPLQDASGKEYPDAALQSWINKAAEWMEHELDVPIRELRTITSEKHDYRQDQNSQFGFLQLHHRPVVSIESMSYLYASSRIMNIPGDWIQLYPEAGQVHIVPSAGTVATLPMTGSGGLIAPWLAGAFSYMPAMIEVTYKAGFGSEVIEGTTQVGGSLNEVILDSAASMKDNEYAFCYLELIDGPGSPKRAMITSYDGFLRKAVFDENTFAEVPDGASYKIERRLIPGDIVDIVTMKALIGILTVAGEFILGAGISSQSISLDGLSESISTTQSAEFDTYGARIKTYRDHIKEVLPLIKKRYAGIRFIAL